MSIKHLMPWVLAVGIALLSGTTANGQDLFDPFAPADADPHALDLFTMHDSPNQGLFFSYGGLYWTISAPEKALVGEPGGQPVADGQLTRVEISTQDNGYLEADFTEGHRFEIGAMNGSKGWLFGSFQLDTQTQNMYPGDTDVLFDDPPQGALGIGLLDGFTDVFNQGIGGPSDTPDGFDDDRDGDSIFGRNGQDTDADGIPDAIAPIDYDDLVRLPVRFSDFKMSNRTKMWGAELMRIFRTKQFHRGGYFDIMIGARYLKIDDKFLVEGRSQNDATQPLLNDILSEAYWYSDAENNIVGPQLAIRWAKTVSRLTMSAEGRFVAGVNFQSLQLRGSLGSEIMSGDQNQPLFMAPTNFQHSHHTEEFSPIVELRFQAAYDLTKCIAVRGGWTGLYTDGVARGSNLIEYTLPAMGLDTDDNTQSVFAQGLNIAIEWNR
jgi:hypothetical protein